MHLGAEADLTAVVVKLNPDAAWERRTQSIEILGRDSSSGTYTTLKARADHTFDPAGNGNTVTVPVTGRVADVQLRFGHNSAGYGAQVAELEVRGTAAPNPDLTVTTLDWTPAAPTETDPVTVRATVRNAGTAPSAATTLDVSLEGAVVGSAPVGALEPGASATVSVNAGTRARGSYTVSAVADPTDTVPELDETNNSRAASDRLTVAQSPGPDLEVTAIRTSPATPAAGAPVSFTVSVHNRGTSPAAGSVTRLTVAGRTLDGTTGAIAAGATAEVALTGTWTATEGPAVLTATADATGTVAETDEDNNVLTRSLVVGRGAAVPYTEYEAEDGAYRGTLLTADAQRTFGHTNFGTESSGRSSVRLDSTGQYVEFTSVNAANSIVVRNSIPDAPGGGGTEATLSLYADGTFVRKLGLSSKHSWLYGRTDDPEGLTNTPRRTRAACSTSPTRCSTAATRRAPCSGSSATPTTPPPSTSST